VTAHAERGDGRLLNGVLELGEIESAEAFCMKLLEDRLRAAGAYLNPTEEEDCLSYLVAECWVLWERYDPAKGTRSFSTYAYRILWRRVASWYRQRFVDTRYRVKPNWVSLDDDDLDDLASDSEWHDPLEAAINVDQLTPAARQTYEQLARPMIVFGYSLGDLATHHGYRRRWVTQKLTELRDEVGPMLDRNGNGS
jgi:RNA polymerase sigma factor (sigma-70 family)